MVDDYYHNYRREVFEDILYTGTLVRKERRYRRTFRFATSRESLHFSWDAIVPIPMPKTLPFGFHRAETFVEFLKRGWVV